MKTVLAVLAAFLGAALLIGAAQAQPRVYNQAELDAMLAPIALHPDGVVSQVLIASTYPDEVAAAARWSRANPHLRGDDALRAVQNEPWDPAVKALVAFPELLLRMDESPQWLNDLGQAFLQQQAQVMDTVQGLRRRAQASGYLTTTDQQSVYYQGDAIVVQPRTQIVYVRYYDPYVVYGPWWWPYYRPVYWHPWAPRPVFLASGFFYTRPDWRQRHVHVVHRPVHVHQHYVVPGRWQPVGRAVQAPAVRPYVRVPEAQRKPIVQSMPAASGFSNERRDVVREQRAVEPRRQQQAEPRWEQRREANRPQRNRDDQQREQRREANHRQHRG